MAIDNPTIVADGRKRDLLIQITDHLFDKGFTISKPLITEIVEWVHPVIEATYQQGIMMGKNKSAPLTKE